MSVQIFIGCIDEEPRNTSIIRNGKTAAMTGFSYLDHEKGWEIWTNYSCSFAEHENIGMQAMINKLKKEDMSHKKVVMCVSELGDILDSVGSTTNQVLFINSFLRQIGKIGGSEGEVLFRGDLQRFFDLHKRFRIHSTEIMIPVKVHMDDKTQCNSIKCKRNHQIEVYLYKPCLPELDDKPIQIFNAQEVGKLYDTYQIVKDKLTIPSKKELERIEKNKNNDEDDEDDD